MFRGAGQLLRYGLTGALIAVPVVQYGRQRWQDQQPTALHLDLRQPYPETLVPNIFGKLLGREQSSFFQLLRALDFARSDLQLGCIVVRVSDVGLGLAQAEEARSALARFAKETGKPVLVVADGLMSTKAYFLASAGTHIALHPKADCLVNGIAMEPLFAKALLDKMGIERQVEKREEYKNALDFLIRDSMSDSHRKQATDMLHWLAATMKAEIAHSRGLSLDSVDAAFSAGWFGADAALSMRLIDSLRYPFEAVDEFCKGLVMHMDLDRYMNKVRRSSSPFRKLFHKAPKVAVISLNGPILDGASGGSFPPSDQKQIFSDDTVRLLDLAVLQDPLVEAVVIRVSSPGGSYIASDVISRFLERVRTSNGVRRHVVVSMGDVAASGGYFISCPANVVYCNKTTVTGSIGVLMGKPSFGKFLDTYGVHADAVETHRHSRILSPFLPWNEQQQQLIADRSNAIYGDFVRHVSRHRKMPEQVLFSDLARGRVYAGTEAVGLGLVDKIGGFQDALSDAKRFVLSKHPEINSEQDILVEAVPKQMLSLDVTGRSREYLQLLGRDAALAAAAVSSSNPPLMRQMHQAVSLLELLMLASSKEPVLAVCPEAFWLDL